VEVKRPGSLAWSRRAVESALAQAMRYAADQKVKAVAVSDGLMLYAANIADGGLRDRVFVSLSEGEPPLALWWLSVQGIRRERECNEGAQLRLLPEEPVEPEAGRRRREAPSACSTPSTISPPSALPTLATTRSRIRGSCLTCWMAGPWMSSGFPRPCRRS
jgi:hypothetical protein